MGTVEMMLRRTACAVMTVAVVLLAANAAFALNPKYYWNGAASGDLLGANFCTDQGCEQNPETCGHSIGTNTDWDTIYACGGQSTMYSGEATVFRIQQTDGGLTVEGGELTVSDTLFIHDSLTLNDGTLKMKYGYITGQVAQTGGTFTYFFSKYDKMYVQAGGSLAVSGGEFSTCLRMAGEGAAATVSSSASLIPTRVELQSGTFTISGTPLVRAQYVEFEEEDNFGVQNPLTYDAPSGTTVEFEYLNLDRLVDGPGLMNTTFVVRTDEGGADDFYFGRINASAAADNGCTLDGMAANNGVGKIVVGDSTHPNVYCKLQSGVLYVNELVVADGCSFTVDAGTKLRYGTISLGEGANLIVDVDGEACQVGSGSVALSVGALNPAQEEVKPQGEAFTAAHIKLTGGQESGNAEITAMTFSFEGDSERQDHIGAALLYQDAACDGAGESLLGQTQLSGGKASFSLTETLQPQESRCYALKYKYAYVTEYTQAPAAGSAHARAAECATVEYGASITTADIAATVQGQAAEVTGSAVTGTVTPALMNYVHPFVTASQAHVGRILEASNGSNLDIWNAVTEMCSLQPTGYVVEETRDAYGDTTILYIKDYNKIHYISPWADQPSFRVYDCSWAMSESQSPFTAEVLDYYVEEEQFYFAPGLTVENPYTDCCLQYEDEIWLIATTDDGNYSEFKANVVTPLRSVWGDENVILNRYKKYADGYLGRVRILTHDCAQKAVNAVLDSPDISEVNQRSVYIQWGEGVPLYWGMPKGVLQILLQQKQAQ